MTTDAPHTAFCGDRLIAAGALSEVRHPALAAAEVGSVLVFEDATGKVVDLDPREEPQAVRGRPRLGVVAREVTLLPRHWEWLEAQPGGASAALRRLVEAARRERAGEDARRAAQERAYRVMSALAGDRAGFEEAVRALFAGDAARFAAEIRPWPDAVASYVGRLAADAFE